MFSSRRVVALAIMAVVLIGWWFTYGSGDKAHQAEAAPPAAGDADMQAKLDTAADAIASAATQGAHAAQSEEELLSRTDMSVEALRLLSELGSSTANAKADELLDAVQKEASPAAKEVIIRMRLARQLQRWSSLSKAEREKAIDRFVADVKAEGLTPSHVELLMRLTENLEMGGNRELAKRAVTELIPAFQNSTEPMIQRRTELMEGVARRLDLVGKPLELEGKTLDGKPFDWESYRGKVVLVDFFANWCQVCREEVPFVLQNYQAYHDKGFEIVGVSLDRHPQLAEQYRRQTGFMFPTLFSDNPQAMEWKSPLATKYGITALPRAIIVDQEGNVAETNARGERLTEVLRELLGPSAGAPRAVGQSDEEPTGALGESENVIPVNFEEQPDAAPSAEGIEEEAAPAVPAE